MPRLVLGDDTQCLLHRRLVCRVQRCPRLDCGNGLAHATVTDCGHSNVCRHWGRRCTSVGHIENPRSERRGPVAVSCRQTVGQLRVMHLVESRFMSSFHELHRGSKPEELEGMARKGRDRCVFIRSHECPMR
eukprot:6347966-Prymnesium_polylepis.1